VAATSGNRAGRRAAAWRAANATPALLHCPRRDSPRRSDITCPEAALARGTLFADADLLL